MTRHKRLAFNKLDQERLLRILGEARRELIHAGEGMERRSVSRGAVDTLVSNIDELAFFLTGTRDHFWVKPH